MKNQVLSIEQMQHLQELGVDTSKASCFWWYAEGEYHLYWGKCSDINGIPTFNLQDMLEMLPLSITGRFYDGESHQTVILKILPCSDNKWVIAYVEEKRNMFIYESEITSNLLTCAYEILCLLAGRNTGGNCEKRD